MTFLQRLILFLSAALFTLLYFGFDTVPPYHKAVEKQRLFSAVSTDVTTLLSEARKTLTSAQASKVFVAENAVEAAENEMDKAEGLKKLSSAWFENEKPFLAGHYAREVAGILKTDEAWSIAGTTFLICLQQEETQKVKDFCTQSAVECLENATSLNPENLQHRINLALVYVTNPPKESPMKGVQMLLELERQHPRNTKVLTQLGHLALKTGQVEKAVERLQQALEADTSNRVANCLLAEAYRQLGQQELSLKYEEICGQTPAE